MKQGPQRISSPTTKVRRLGYFILFSQILRENPLPHLILQQRIIDDDSLEKNRELLEKACKQLPVRRRGSEIVTARALL